MNEIKIFQVDAFTSNIFSGNPAAVCPLDNWLEAETLQQIAKENNLSETAFFVINNDHVELRWFTPEYEIDLCGHATLASSHVLFNILNWKEESIVFKTKSGDLLVKKENDLLAMDFPSRPGEEIETPKELTLGLGLEPSKTILSRDYMAVFETEKQVAELEPDFHILSMLDCVGIIATAPADDDDQFDFISRFFAPRAGVNEDPVTGSAHCTLTPYWSDYFGKNELTAMQISQRGGILHLDHKGERVIMKGNAAIYLEGKIYI